MDAFSAGHTGLGGRLFAYFRETEWLKQLLIIGGGGREREDVLLQQLLYNSILHITVNINRSRNVISSLAIGVFLFLLKEEETEGVPNPMSS